jgi:predicted transcriptional regulator of viral defense system
MARPSKITLAQKHIGTFFTQTAKSVYPDKELYQLLEEKRGEWDLPATTTTERIAQKLVENGFIRRQVFKLSDQTEHVVYFYQDPSIYEIAVSLRPKSYISHYPAVFLHELTTQIPKTIYATVELSSKQNRNSYLNQESIDKAFSLPQRRSHLSTSYEDYTIILLNAMHSNRSGVLLSTRYNNAFSFTSLERTLIDITVRPNYAGGAFAVLEAFKKAVEQYSISSNKFMSIYESIPFIYPYQQAIGFYLERTGYKGALLELLNKSISPFKFYLDYQMQEKNYDEKWRIWYPSGM